MSGRQNKIRRKSERLSSPHVLLRDQERARLANRMGQELHRLLANGRTEGTYSYIEGRFSLDKKEIRYLRVSVHVQEIDPSQNQMILDVIKGRTKGATIDIPELPEEDLITQEG